MSQITEEERRKLKNTLFYQHHIFLLSIKILKLEIVRIWRPNDERVRVAVDRVKAEIRSLETKPELLFDL